MKTRSYPSLLFATALAMATFVTIALAGCAQHGYVDPASNNFYKADRETHSDIKIIVDKLLLQMQNSKTFTRHYKNFVDQNNRIPVLSLGNISNDTTERVGQLLQSARKRLEFKLLESELFDIVDDAASQESISEDMAASITTNADVGLKDGRNMEVFGGQTSEDYQIYGFYKKHSAGDRHVYELTLNLVDLKTGKKIWIGVDEVDKE